MQRLIAFVLLLFSSAALAQEQMEIIALKHRTVDSVIPVLRPLLEPGGTLTGMNNRLIVRASSTNLEQIKQALAAIDTPLRRLMIFVKQDNDRAITGSGGDVSGSVGAGGAGGEVRISKPGAPGASGATVEIRRGDDVLRGRTYSTRGHAEDRVTQQVQTVEGGQAFIQVGYSFPLPFNQVWIGPYDAVVSSSVVYRDIGTGFFARPSLSGDRVTIEISPQQESLSATVPGAVRSQRLVTTVSGRLGEWIELGGTTGAEQSDRSGTLSYSTRGTLEQRRVLLKVEELR